MRFVSPLPSIFLDFNLPRGWRKYLAFQFVCRTNREPRPCYEIETRGETLDRLRLSNDVITRIYVNYWNCLQIPLTLPYVRIRILFRRSMKARRLGNFMAEYRPFLESWIYLGLTSPRVECNLRLIKLEIDFRKIVTKNLKERKKEDDKT